MEDNIIKLDLDLESADQAVALLKERLCHLHYMSILHFEKIDKIVISKKSKWNAKITLNKPLAPQFTVLCQLLLGSDWKKELYTLYNHYHLKMDYSNRLFDAKRYLGGEVKFTEFKYEVTKEIRSYVYHPKNLEKFNQLII